MDRLVSLIHSGLSMGVSSRAYLSLLLCILSATAVSACSDLPPEVPPVLTVDPDMAANTWDFICHGVPYQPNTYVTAELASLVNASCAKLAEAHE